MDKILLASALTIMVLAGYYVETKDADIASITYTENQ